MKNLILRPLAERDLVEAHAWYESKRLGLGEEFVAAVEGVFDRIAAFPESYAREYREVRPAGLRRFPYVIYYRILESAIEVLGVVHGNRNPAEWRSRA